jgi:heme-degrading monooxygenase HmoA
MITVGMNYQVRDGKQAIFENAFNKVLTAMQGMPGHAQSFLYRDVNHPLSYLIVSEWSDRQAFEAFVASDTFRNVVTWGKEQILTARPKHEIYEK